MPSLLSARAFYIDGDAAPSESSQRLDEVSVSGRGGNTQQMSGQFAHLLTRNLGSQRIIRLMRSAQPSFGKNDGLRHRSFDHRRPGFTVLQQQGFLYARHRRRRRVQQKGGACQEETRNALVLPALGSQQSYWRVDAVELCARGPRGGLSSW